MHYNPHYPTILPPYIALYFILAANILFPVSAYFIARRFKRNKWLPN
ncbi:hypothetical protein GGD56_004989 [Rhizobium mongolense]|uniref:Uncharacterized protein n=2 Tax=Rhizobium mongolense TaxID=57676 RepID=A0ABR6IT84_9HYPH|nr:hypothetical protein [Rhizobium mongolense]TVZ66583.1 hypothetical protein BCL32_6961 [Rhizobium mongolense USDA 1844]